jgi:hypothetical protein
MKQASVARVSTDSEGSPDLRTGRTMVSTFTRKEST